jgi:hypothetical protein
MRRPVVTLTVKPSDASFFSQELLCHIDTGADPSLVLRSYEVGRRLGLSLSDRTAFVGDPETELDELADGSLSVYLIDFVFITEWVNGRSLWVKVLVPPRKAARGMQDMPPDAGGYKKPEAVIGLDLLMHSEFRMNHTRDTVELLAVD